MATGNLLLGLGRRSLGDVVMYRRNGKQVSRVRVRNIKNPRTEAQMISRIIANTVAQAYSRFKEITNHSFETVTRGAKSQSRFNKVNTRMLRQALVSAGEDWNLLEGFVPVGYRGLVQNTYIMSEGSYKAIPASAQTLSEQKDKFLLALSANTYQKICDTYGLQRGDQLTFVTIMGNVADITDPMGFPAIGNITAAYSRVILDPYGTDGVPVGMESNFISDGNQVAFPNPKNSGNQAFTFEYIGGEDGKVGHVAISMSDKEVLAYGIIVSHKQADGTYQYSNCQLQVSPVTLYDNMGQALAHSQSGQVDVTNPLYLNQAKN